MKTAAEMREISDIAFNQYVEEEVNRSLIKIETDIEKSASYGLCQAILDFPNIEPKSIQKIINILISEYGYRIISNYNDSYHTFKVMWSDNN